MVLLDAAQQLKTGSLIHINAPAAESMWSAKQREDYNTGLTVLYKKRRKLEVVARIIDFSFLFSFLCRAGQLL